MTEDQYKSLCDACDQVLLAGNASQDTVAISWLHIIREHPMFLEKYAELFQSKSRLQSLRDRFLRRTRKVAANLIQYYRTLRSYRKTPQDSNLQLPKSDVLFVSHLLNNSQRDSSSDFYYGELPSELVKRGYVVTVALIDHTHSPIPQVVGPWFESNVCKVLIPRCQSIQTELEFKRRLKLEARRLRLKAKSQNPSFIQKVMFRAAEEAESNASADNLRIGSFISELIGMVKPKVMVVTHEGHAWERVAFLRARQAEHVPFCVAYQHAAMFRLQHAIQRNLSAVCNPDFILTAGPIGKGQLEGRVFFDRNAIAVLGSARASSCIEMTPVHIPVPNIRIASKKKTCLVLPEGIESECNLLFDFSLACALANPEIQFIWRLHPLQSFESLKKRNPKMNSLPGNIYLSEQSLTVDIALSQFALYRGTTAVISAVKSGLRPIYLQIPGEMTIDPLYELKNWRLIVSGIDELSECLKESPRESEVQDNEMRAAQRYCECFYTPFDLEVMDRIIQDQCIAGSNRSLQ